MLQVPQLLSIVGQTANTFCPMSKSYLDEGKNILTELVAKELNLTEAYFASIIVLLKFLV